MNRKLRIMHGLREIAGQNSYSVRGLREIGEEAECIIYCKHPFDYPYDQCLYIDKANKSMYLVNIFKLGIFFLKAMRRYDCFHFHFGESILNGIELPLYKWSKKKVFFEFHGSDLRDMEIFCKISGSGLQFDPKEATSSKVRARNRKICSMADGIILHDDELIPYLPAKCTSVYVVPLRVDIAQFDPCYPKLSTEKIRIVHAPSKRAGKGTKYVLKVFEILKKRHKNIELVLVEGKTQQEAFEIYRTADIIVDQLFAGTYGVFAIESMALGKPVVTYISDWMKERLPEELPIVSGNMNTLENVLETLIQDGKKRREIGIAGRKYVENYHDYRYGARVLRDIYYCKSKPLTGRDAFNQVKKIRQKAEEYKNV